MRATFGLEVNEWNGISEPRLLLRHAVARASALEQDDAAMAGVQAGVELLQAEPDEGQTEELVLFALP